MSELVQSLLDGQSVRAIATALRMSPMTIRKVRATLILPDCKCGLPAGHKGWCAHRLAHSPKRQRYISFELPAHNRRIAALPKKAVHCQKIADALVGVPKKADAETIAQVKKEPLCVRRGYRATRLALAHPLGMDSSFFIHEYYPSSWPDPCQMLIMKEQWEERLREDRRFKLWRRAKPAVVKRT